MNEQQTTLLQETHDSTIRQEVMIKQIVERLDAGDERFAKGDQRFDAHDKRMAKLEAAVKPLGLAVKLAWAFVGGLILAGSAWLVDWLAGRKP